jgi:acyl-CoA reductase-like NAD-dependent aldehyde dehydrogenase
VVDPSTGEVFETCACESRDEIEDAVTAAVATFPAWSATSLDERRVVLIKMAEALEANLDSIARTLTCEQGKVGGSAYFLRYYAGLPIPVKVLEDSDSRLIELHRRPLGVVVAIVPWNFPVLTAINKIGAALLTGNTVVVKPAATTPLATLQIAAHLKDIAPAGVVNIVTDKNDLGDELSGHPLFRKVSFTGSTNTGMKVISSGSATLKRMTLELGGHDSGIVLDDCDPETVSQQLFDSAFVNNG